MEIDSNTYFDQLRAKHETQTVDGISEPPEGLRLRLRTLLVALLGVSMSACALLSQPVELEIDDDDVAQRLANVSFARRITKPTIRLVMGCGKLGALVTVLSSLLLLIAVMAKDRWRLDTRCLALPALLLLALEAAADAGDAALSAALTARPARAAAQVATAAILVTVEILAWYFIAKFFEYTPPMQPAHENEKENVKAIPI